jgi:isoleucyl-tRNA synthetase
MENYRLDRATRPITDLLDDVSNWFVRRSRRRFWKAEDDSDKQQAYATLNYVILRTCQLLAPFSPFLPDYVWRQMVQGTDLPESVHLSDWPSVNKPDSASQKLLEDMKLARFYIVEGLAQRAAAGIKVRQPLASVEMPKLPEELKNIVAEELNVKDVRFTEGEKGSSHNINLDINVTPDLKSEGTARELVRIIQNARKNAGFNVDDRIKTKISTDSSDISEAYTRYKKIVDSETLTVSSLSGNPEYSEIAKIDGQEVKLELSRASL